MAKPQWKIEYYREGLLNVLEEDLKLDINQFSNEQLDAAADSLIVSVDQESMVNGNDVATSNRYKELEGDIKQLHDENKKNLSTAEMNHEKTLEELRNSYLRRIRNLYDEIERLNDYIRTNCR